ncbi:MAG: hypothetical protein EWV89_04795 [Microcystis wesenbergii Mw_QC_B_20070930_S4]|jgi:hypothetical protein|nr:MAG: hypothetical protein EWV73_13465 [Microcystis wesenbergii Mw_QC_B_20070930_S4D]TRV16689.1 MAG: hypothetical protein EWV89_04795 [Microcystis wesenbergii Mw_QC_B_20070930_S4]
MKNRLCLHLMANKEKGFALPLAVLIGLILMGTGMTMMMRAQADQSKVIAQNARADGLRSSEAGVARVQDLLNSVRVMARFNSNCTSGDCWQTAEVPTTGNPSTDFQKNLKRLNITTACGNPSRNNEIANKIFAPTNQRAASPGLRDLASGEWFQLNDNRYYRVVGYQFIDSNNPNTLDLGVLTLEGRSRKSAETDLANTELDRDSDDNAASRNRVVVSIPILPSLPLAFTNTTAPALWISEGATENVDQTSDIAVGSADYFGGANFQGDVVMSDTTTFDEGTGTLQPELECFISTDKIQQPTPNTPYKAQFVPVPFPELPKIPDQENLPEDQKNLELTSSKTFPQPGDTPSSSGAYEYIVNNINLSGSDKITITPGQRVVFYVQGNINGAIEHDCSSVSPPTVCKPGNLQIYAYYNKFLEEQPEPEICLNGNQRLEAFIFAPTYSLGKTGTGTFIGAAWGKNWGKISTCASPGGTVAVTQGVEWTDLPRGLKPNPLETLPRLDNISNWCEEPIDTDGGESQCVPQLPNP